MGLLLRIKKHSDDNSRPLKHLMDFGSPRLSGERGAGEAYLKQKAELQLNGPQIWKIGSALQERETPRRQDPIFSPCFAGSAVV
jgi:hypothetical protein